jgi:hypothetical protein
MSDTGSDSDWGIDDEPQASNGTNEAGLEDDDALLRKKGFATSTSVSITKKGTADTAESLFNEWKLTTRSGRSTASLSQLTHWLAKLGIEGPRNLRGLNLRDSSDEIGHGSQFTVFRSTHTLDQSSVKEVFKRVRISKRALRKEKSLAMNSDYLVGLRQLELEVLSSGLLKHRNIVRLLGWGCEHINHSDFQFRGTDMYRRLSRSVYSSSGSHYGVGNDVPH